MLAAVLLSALALGQGVAVAAPPVTASGPTGEVRSEGEESRVAARIVGGNTTTNSKYPWQANIGTGGDLFCGGSLIHPYIVLTAAHCLVDEFGNFNITPLEVEVHLGRTQISSGGASHLAFELYAHPDYDPDSSANDVAFISLVSPSPGARIQLAGPSERALWTPGRQAFVSGWGTTSQGGSVSPVLKEALVPIIDDGSCARPDVYGGGFIGASMVCAGYLAGGTDSCQGDSGGPLQSPIDGGGFRLTGIVSWGIGCAQPNKPGVYARIGIDPLQSFVREAVDFIEENEGLPVEVTGIDVIGSGARPPGCAAAEAAIGPANAAAAAAATAAAAQQQAAVIAARPVKGAIRAKKAAQRAKRKATSKAALRKAGKRLAKAGKRLRKVKRNAKAASGKAAQVSATAAAASSAASAAAANKAATCG